MQNTIKISNKSIVFRGQYLKHTEYVIGIILQVGLNTKMLKNIKKIDKKTYL